MRKKAFRDDKAKDNTCQKRVSRRVAKLQQGKPLLIVVNNNDTVSDLGTSDTHCGRIVDARDASPNKSSILIETTAKEPLKEAAFNVDQLKKLVKWKLKGKPAKGTKTQLIKQWNDIGEE